MSLRRRRRPGTVRLPPALRVVGLVVGGAGLTIAAPLVYALAIGDSIRAFALPLAIAIVLFVGALRLGRRIPAPTRRESLLAAVLTWVGLSLFGILPYVLGSAAGGAGAPIDAFFESTAGFTATGSTVITELQAQSRPLMLWRAQTQWIGGIGLIVLAVIFLPRLAVGGRQLIETEVAGPQLEKLAPHLRASTIRIVAVYVALTVLVIGGLIALGQAGLAPGMDSFQAVAHAFTTVSAGGFSPNPRSIEPFGPWAQWLIAVAIVIAGTNLALWYRAIALRRPQSFRDDELRWYLVILAVACVVLVSELALAGTYGLADSVRQGVFQAASIMTGTGYATADFAQWSELALGTLFLLMFVGGCTGSPTGALKVMRVVLATRVVLREIRATVHPDQIRLIRTGGRSLNDRVIHGVVVFVLLYLALVVISGVLLLVDPGRPAGLNFEDALSATAASIGNVGPGFGIVGPMGSYASFSDQAKIFLSLLMVVGRLEIFPVLVLLTSAFWRD
jgi:trk system potassium uptake protein TrkH